MGDWALRGEKGIELLTYSQGGGQEPLLVLDHQEGLWISGGQVPLLVRATDISLSYRVRVIVATLPCRVRAVEEGLHNEWDGQARQAFISRGRNSREVRLVCLKRRTNVSDIFCKMQEGPLPDCLEPAPLWCRRQSSQGVSVHVDSKRHAEIL